MFRSNIDTRGRAKPLGFPLGGIKNEFPFTLLWLEQELYFLQEAVRTKTRYANEVTV